MTEAVDAVVIGSGPNGLVAANLLADAGWSVRVLEAAPSIGGAVHSSRDVHPDFVHDTASAFYPLAVESPTLQAMDLDQWGLSWAHAPAAVGHPLPGGGWGLVHRDPEVTAALLDQDHPGDGEAWLATYARFEALSDAIFASLLSPFPPARGAAGLARRLPGAGGIDLVRSLLMPARALAEHLFEGQAARMLLTGNALHADIPLDAPGSGGFGWLMSMMSQHVGFPAPVGGAGMLATALARRLEARGGTITCDAEVTEVRVVDGRARGVVVRGGEQVDAAHAVLADVAAPRLYGGLVAPEHLPARVHRGMAAFEWDPGTLKVDWALSGPVPWADAPAYAPGTVHVGGSIHELAAAQNDVRSGVEPKDPFLLIGQMTTTDPSRSPAGTESLWAYAHLPADIDPRRSADRLQARLERHAPGFGDLVLERRVLGPRDLEAHDANLVGGAVNGGTASLHQQAVLRPMPGLGRAETPVRGLYLASASAHPGGGVHGACGSNAARAALAHHRLGAPVRLLRRRSRS